MNLLELLVDTALRGSGLLLLGFGIALLLGRKRAELRRSAWIVILASLLLLPLAITSLPGLRIAMLPPTSNAEVLTSNEFHRLAMRAADTPIDNTTQTEETAAVTDDTHIVQGNTARMTPVWPMIWPTIWLLGLFVASALFALQLFRLRRALTGAIDVRDPELLRALASARSELGLKTRIRLREGDGTGPFTCGIFRPTVVLPRGMAWSEERLRLVLLHECAHIVRRDWLWLMVGRAALLLHWFNPLAHLAMRRFHEELELACDRSVIRFVPASDYAREMLAISKDQHPGSAAALAMGHPTRLGRRLERLLGDSTGVPARTLQTGLVAGTAGLCVLAATLSAAPKPVAPLTQNALLKEARAALTKRLATPAKDDKVFGTYAGARAMAAMAVLGPQPLAKADPASQIAVLDTLALLDAKTKDGMIGGSMYEHAYATRLYARIAQHGKAPFADALTTLDDSEENDSAKTRRVIAKRDIQPLLKKATQFLIEHQNETGGWRYTPKSLDADSSVVSTVLITLCEARKAGIKIDKQVIERAEAFLLSCQTKEGGFGYTRPGPPMKTANTTAIVLAGLLSVDPNRTDVGPSLDRLCDVKEGIDDFSQKSHLGYCLMHAGTVGALVGSQPTRDRLHAWAKANQRPDKLWSTGTDAAGFDLLDTASILLGLESLETDPAK